MINENQKHLKKSSTQTSFFIGDSVLISRGQMQGVKGKILSLTQDTARIKIKNRHKEIEEEVEVNDIVKYFEEGSRVKVISGNNEGVVILLLILSIFEYQTDFFNKKTGTVLGTTGDFCSVFTDNRNTIEVRPKDLAVTGDSG